MQSNEKTYTKQKHLYLFSLRSQTVFWSSFFQQLPPLTLQLVKRHTVNTKEIKEKGCKQMPVPPLMPPHPEEPWWKIQLRSLAQICHTPGTLRVFAMVCPQSLSPCAPLKTAEIKACWCRHTSFHSRIKSCECSHAFVLRIAIVIYQPSGLM